MLRRLAEDLVLAMTFMTRLPLPVAWIRARRRLADAYWAMPLAGAVVGACLAATVVLGQLIGLGPLASAVAGVALATILTGALHEDGLADLCDGLGGAGDRARRLEIMDDPRIGTYGTGALVLAVLMQCALVAQLAVGLDRWSFVFTLAGAGAAARAALPTVFLALPPAKSGGLARCFGRPGGATTIAGLGLTIAGLIACLGWNGAMIGVGAVAGNAIIAGLAARYLGGYTGDVLGAAITLGFLSALTAATI